MNSLRSFSLTTLTALALFAASARADHKDARLGFSIQTPRDWNQIPMKVDERWMVADYQAEKPCFYTEKSGGWTYEHRPDVQMIAFVSDAVKAKAKVTKKEDRKGNTVILIDFDSPYKDYKDYMTRRYTGGGWFINKEEETKVGDIKVTTYEIKVEKLSQDGPKRIVTWIYHIPDVDIAVQFECLENVYSKFAADFTRCFKSFKPIPRSGEALVEDVSTGHRLTFLEIDELTPEERKNARISLEREAHARAQKKLIEGWTAKKMGRFLVLNHTDDKFANFVVDQAEAVMAWLEQTFPFVGEKEYVRSPVLRICKDEIEYRQFQKLGGYSFNDLEIVAYQDYGGTTSSVLKDLKTRIFDIWFEDRDREMYWAMPRWLKDGLRDVIRELKTKGGKVTFGSDDWSRDEVRNAVREGTQKKPRELMTMTGDELWKGNFVNAQQVQVLVGFYVSGAAAKNARTKTMLQDYVKGVKDAQLAIKAEKETKPDEASKRPTTEEEEDAAFKAQRQNYNGAEKRMLDEAWKRTFGKWSEKDWDAFEEIYFKAIG